MSKSVKLELELQDATIMGEYGNFGNAKDPVEDNISKIMFGVDSGGKELTCVDMDGEFNVINIYQLQENVTEAEIKKFCESKVDDIIEWAKDRISDLIWQSKQNN